MAFAAAALSLASTATAKAVYPEAPRVNQSFTFSKSATDGRFMTPRQAFKNRVVNPNQTFGTRADVKQMNWGYCGEPANALNITGEFQVAIMMTEDDAQQFVGNSITAVNVANPTNRNYVNPVDKATVWIADSLGGNPIATGTGALGSDGFEWSTIALDQPVAIDKAKNIYIGVSLNVPKSNNNFGYMVDDIYPESEHSAYLYSNYRLTDDGQLTTVKDYIWQSVGMWAGNACVQAVIEGDNLPQNAVSMQDYIVPSVVAPGEEFEIAMGLMNIAANEVSKVTVSMQIGDAEPQTQECEIAVGLDPNTGDYVMGALNYNQYGIVMASFKCDRIANNIPWTLKITKLNDGADNNSKDSISGMLLCIKEGFAKNNVLEEATGTWCGACPIGYAGMEWLSENAPNFIGIGVHGDDQMDVLGRGGAYEPFSAYIESFPSSFLNRNWKDEIYPAPEELEYTVEDYGGLPAMAQIDAKIENIDDSGKKIRLSATYRFSIAEDDADYAVGYTVVEDKVGPYNQTNYMTGSDEYAYGFENQPNPVRLMYNEVARNCSHPTAVEGSEVKATEVGKDYTFSTEINLSDVKNLANYRVVAYVLNGRSGFIENACQVVSPSNSGVGKVEAESKSTPLAYGGKGCINVLAAGDNMSVVALDGRVVANKVRTGRISAEPGVYVVTDGTRSAKVFVR